jgi:WD40 repeat protein
VVLANRFKKSLTEHSRFVTCTRFSPNGEKVATVGLDKKGIIWDGKTGYIPRDRIRIPHSPPFELLRAGALT